MLRACSYVAVSHVEVLFIRGGLSSRGPVHTWMSLMLSSCIYVAVSHVGVLLIRGGLSSCGPVDTWRSLMLRSCSSWMSPIVVLFIRGGVLC